jgi:guanylate kinase
VAVVPQGALEELAAQAAGKHTPRLFVLSAPSGTGKDTAIDEMRRRGLAIHVVVTYTTRARRTGEIDGTDYNFVSVEAFERMRLEGELLEDAEYARNLYGVPRQPVEEALRRGEDVLLKIEVQGASIVKLKVPSTVLIFLAPPTVELLEQRLRDRQMREKGSVDEADLQRRLAAATRELACIPGYDYLVINHPGRLEEAAQQIETIIRAERHRVNVAPVRV